MRSIVAETLVILSVLYAATADAHDCPNRWPHSGSMFYDGDNYLDYQFEWHTLPSWHFYPSAFEMNTSFETSFATGCASWTDLPDPYDDCGTAGTFEQDPVIYAGAFGTYDAWAIQPGRYYYGSMWLTLTWNAFGSSFDTYAQELWNDCRIQGIPDSPWCVGPYDDGDGRGLTSGYLLRWAPEVFTWLTETCYE